MSSRPAVFLDRDGTIVEEVDFLTEVDQLVLLPGAADAIRRLNDAGFVVVVVTNQSGIARGFLDEARLDEIHAELRVQLAAEGARLDLLLHCPHHPDAGEPPWRRECPCRKPAPGMLHEAAQRLDLDLAKSWIVGDSARDLEAGRAAGVRGLLVATGKPVGDAEALPDLAAAVDAILG